jgi:hypothetical protein
MSKKPDNKVETNLAKLPAALAPLCQVDHWVLWRWEQRKGKWTKPPFMATDPRRKAKNNDPATWASYATAVAAASTADGIGFALLDTPFVAIDLDHCLAGELIDPWAQDWIEQANGAYVERTPSGEGLRIIGRGSGEKLHRKWKIDGAREGAAIEIYRGCERYITVTGAQLGECQELSELDLLDKIALQYDGKEQGDKTQSNDGGFDFNTTGASLDYDEIIRSRAPTGADASAVFHATIGHLSAKGLSVDKIIELLSKWPNGIARRYAGRLRGEVERSFEKWQSKRKIRAGVTAGAGAAVEPDEPLMWEATDKNGRPLATCANARRALLALEVKCRYDVFHDKHIVEGKIVLPLANLDLVVADLRRKVGRHAAARALADHLSWRREYRTQSRIRPTGTDRRRAPGAQARDEVRSDCCTRGANGKPQVDANRADGGTRKFLRPNHSRRPRPRGAGAPRRRLAVRNR